MSDSFQSRVMGQGLRWLNRLAGSRLLDDAGRRAGFTRLLYGASRTGFGAAGLANRPFRAVIKAARAARPAAARAPDLFDLQPTDEQQMLADAARDFADHAIRPIAAAADRDHATGEELLTTAAELGLAAIQVPEEHGGTAAERAHTTQALIAESLAHGDMGIALRLLSGAGVATLLAEYGSGAQQARFLPAFCEEQPPHAALAIADGRDGTTTASEQAGGYRLRGCKPLVIDAGRAELFVVAAELDGREELFLVESGSPGLRWTPQPAMGLNAASLSRLNLDDVAVPTDARLPAVDADAVRAACRLGIAALAAGTCRAVLDYVIPYANERQAFGEPISHRQAVAFLIADIGIELEGLRLLLLRAAARRDAGREIVRDAALAHGMAVRQGRRIGSDGVQLLGGHGFVCEHPVERWYRDLCAVSALSTHFYL